MSMPLVCYPSRLYLPQCPVQCWLYPPPPLPPSSRIVTVSYISKPFILSFVLTLRNNQKQINYLLKSLNSLDRPILPFTKRLGFDNVLSPKTTLCNVFSRMLEKAEKLKFLSNRNNSRQKRQKEFCENVYVGDGWNPAMPPSARVPYRHSSGMTSLTE